MLNSKIQRRNFLKLGAGILAVSAASAASAVVRPARAGEEIVMAEIARNHGHMFTVSLAELVGNGPQVYSIQGSSGHAHSIDIDEATLEALSQGMDVEFQSSTGRGHTHDILLMAK